MLFANGSGVRSTDGTSWADINLPGTVTSLAWDVAAGVWAASAGASAAIFTSPDGLVWTTQSIETMFGDNRVHVGNYSQGLILVQTTAPYAAAVTAGDTNLIKVPDVPFSNMWISRAITQAPQAGTELLIGGSAGEIIWASVDPLPGQFRTPIDNPAYGWVKAKES